MTRQSTSALPRLLGHWPAHAPPRTRVTVGAGAGEPCVCTSEVAADVAALAEGGLLAGGDDPR